MLANIEPPGKHKLFRAPQRARRVRPKMRPLQFFAFHPNKIWHRRRFPNLVHRIALIKVLVSVICATAASTMASPFPASGPIVSGRAARLRSGTAAAPEDAPVPVKRAIWAANQLRSKPYKYGGGHRSFSDNGYDCSGTVSYVLGGAGLLRSPISSSDFRKFGERGRGKWITIYARNGHAFAVIAGLRFDTTPWDNSSNRFAPRWQSTSRMPYGFEARHPVGL